MLSCGAMLEAIGNANRENSSYLTTMIRSLSIITKILFSLVIQVVTWVLCGHVVPWQCDFSEKNINFSKVRSKFLVLCIFDKFAPKILSEKPYNTPATYYHDVKTK